MDVTIAFTTIVTVTLVSLSAIAAHGCKQVEETRREAIKVGLVEKDGYLGHTLWSKP